MTTPVSRCHAQPALVGYDDHADLVFNRQLDVLEVGAKTTAEDSDPRHTAGTSRLRQQQMRCRLRRPQPAQVGYTKAGHI